MHNAFISFADHAQSQFGIAVGRYVILPDHFAFVRQRRRGHSVGKMGRHVEAISQQSRG